MRVAPENRSAHDLMSSSSSEIATRGSYSSQQQQQQQQPSSSNELERDSDYCPPPPPPPPSSTASSSMMGKEAVGVVNGAELLVDLVCSSIRGADLTRSKLIALVLLGRLSPLTGMSGGGGGGDNDDDNDPEPDPHGVGLTCSPQTTRRACNVSSPLSSPTSATLPLSSGPPLCGSSQTSCLASRPFHSRMPRCFPSISCRHCLGCPRTRRRLCSCRMRTQWGT